MSMPSSFQSVLLPDVDTMEIKSEVLDPITATDSLVVFQLPKTGTLDSGSMVTLGCVLSDATKVGDFFYPIDSGIHSLIKSVTLKIGNKIVAQSQDHTHFATMMRKFKTPEERAFKDMPRQGCVGDRFALHPDGRIVYRDMASSDNNTLTVPEFVKPTADDSTTPVFSIMLSEFLPAFKNQQIPLFAIKDHVYIELVLRSQSSSVGDIGQICCSNDPTVGAEVKFSKVNCKFLYDGLYYSDAKNNQVMESAASEKGLTYLYEDILETIASVPAGVDNQAQTIEREVALSGKYVRSIMISDKPVGASTVLQGQYISRDQVKPSTLNLRVNDQRMFDRGITSPPRKYDELSFAAAQPLQVPSQLYSYDVDTDSSGAITQNSFFVGSVEGMDLCPADSSESQSSTDIRGTSHYVGFDLSKDSTNTFENSTLCGVKPIRVEKTYQRGSGDDNSAREMRIFSSVLKSLTIKSGVAMVSA